MLIPIWFRKTEAPITVDSEAPPSTPETEQQSRAFDLLFPTHSVFSIGNLNENALMWLLMLKLSKTPQGMAIIDKFLSGMVETLTKSLSAYCRAGVGNPVSAWGSGRLLSIFMERFGFITQQQAGEFSIGISLIAGAEIVEDLVGTLASIYPFSSAQKPEFPTEVNLGDDVSIKGSTAEDVKRLVETVRYEKK